MPINEYKCQKCGKAYEVLEPQETKPLVCCKCGCIRLDKQISRGTGFKLKGEGWFRDGY